jgi:glycosyltransferase involved in cell wall biosynthesis
MSRRILHVVGDSQFGGGAVLILRIAQEAALKGNHVDVLSTNPQFQKAIRENSLGVIGLDCIWREIRLMRDLVGLWRLYRYLQKHRYDVVHTHTSKAGLIGRAAAFFAHIPVIVHTVHGFAFHEESSPIAVRLYSFLERLAAHWCHKVVTVSKYHRTWALELHICNPGHIVAIPNGISPTRVVPTLARETFRANLGLGPEHLTLVSAGRLATQKGIEYLIDAVKILVDGGMGQLRVILAGDGPLREFLENKVKGNGLEKNFIFLGFRSDVADILNAGDIAVMPTEREGLSISLLEAMAMGKPIVTTTIGSNLEVTEYGRYARLVPPKDAESLVAAISELVLHSKQATAQGDEARAHFHKMYTEQVMLDAYLALYDELAHANVQRH